MSRAIKLKNNDYLDSSSIIYTDYSGARYILKDSLDDIYSQLSNRVETKYLGNTANINNLHYKNGIYGIYGASNPINVSIATLEVIVYSSDWCLQRLTSIETGNMWERRYHIGVVGYKDGNIIIIKP